jgi:hypothetical protein
MPCSDSGPPEIYTEKQLNKLADFMATLHEPSKQEVWKTLPYDLRMEFVWSNWTREK